MTVTCGSTVANLNLVPGVPQTVSNIPLNTSCSVVEGTVPTPGECLPATHDAYLDDGLRATFADDDYRDGHHRISEEHIDLQPGPTKGLPAAAGREC